MHKRSSIYISGANPHKPKNLQQFDAPIKNPKNPIEAEGLGLVNYGAICWFNALIQALRNIPQLKKIANSEEFKGTPFGKTILANSGGDLNQNANALRISLFNFVQSRNIQFDGQQCANEAFTLLLELINSKTLEGLFFQRHYTTYNLPCCKSPRIEDISYQYAIPGQFIDKLDRWILNNATTCQFTCECGKNLQVVAQSVMTRIGPIVATVFAQNNAIPPHLFKIAGNSGEMIYKLVAIVYHRGNNFGGHYYTIANTNGNLVRYDDTRVCQVDAYESGGFIAFYNLEES